jgi:hypothetical protein
MSAFCPARAKAAEGLPAAVRLRPRFTVAEVLRAALERSPRPALPAHHWKTLNALLRCRTEELGGYTYHCEDCGRDHFVPHSCRNRHCSNCQRGVANEWLEKETASLLPVPYFHVVFTLSHALNPLIAQNQRVLYNLLFRAASTALSEFGRKHLQAQIGFTAVLHSWGQTLTDHYHLHCVVTGGGISLDGKRWSAASPDYLFPVDELSEAFQEEFRDGLEKLYAKEKLGFHGRLAATAVPAAFEELVVKACAQPWVVYCKKPFAGPQTVLAYLSRYTHRVAVGNGRILALDRDAGTVTFSYADYADQSRQKTMTLELAEFLRRFCLHILPGRLVKIRHYGLLGNRNHDAKIAAARALIEAAGILPPETARSPQNAPVSDPAPTRVCPHCGSQKLVVTERREARRNKPPTADAAALDSS